MHPTKRKSMILCPFCRDRLFIYENLELILPGREASIYTFQWYHCEKCNKYIFGELEEFIQVFDDDLIHIGYEADTKEWEETLNKAIKCPDKRNKNCSCPVHKYFSKNGLPVRNKGIGLEVAYK